MRTCPVRVRFAVTSHELAGGFFSLKAGKKYQLETDHKAAARARAKMTVFDGLGSVLGSGFGAGFGAFQEAMD